MSYREFVPRFGFHRARARARAFLDSIRMKILCFRSDLCVHEPSLFEPISKASCIFSKLIDWFLVEESCFHHMQPLSHGEF